MSNSSFLPVLTNVPSQPGLDRAVQRLLEAGRITSRSDVVPLVTQYLNSDNSFNIQVLRQAQAIDATFFARWVSKVSQEPTSADSRLEQFEAFSALIFNTPDARASALGLVVERLAANYTDDALPFLKHLVAASADLYKQPEGLDAKSVFMTLCSHRKVDATLTWLLEQDEARVHLNDPDNQGWTSLDFAVWSNEQAKAVQLVEAGADPFKVAPGRTFKASPGSERTASAIDRMSITAIGAGEKLKTAHLVWIKAQAEARAARTGTLNSPHRRPLPRIRS